MIFCVILRALARRISCEKRSFAFAQDDALLHCGGSLCKDDISAAKAHTEHKLLPLLGEGWDGELYFCEKYPTFRSILPCCDLRIYFEHSFPGSLQRCTFRNDAKVILNLFQVLHRFLI